MEVSNVLQQMKAESLLRDSELLTQIANLRTLISRASVESDLNFDDYFFHLQKQVDNIPRVELLGVVPNRMESQYTVQLVEALDKVQERCSLVHNKMTTLQSRVVDVDAAIKDLAGTFDAWFQLAAQAYMQSSSLKMPMATLKVLSSSEFSRLMGYSGTAITSLLAAIKSEINRIDLKKKMAQKKFDLGREQVNASWANQLPGMVPISAEPGSLRLLKEEPMEEEEADIVPTFISQRKAVAAPYFEEKKAEIDAVLPNDTGMVEALAQTKNDLVVGLGIAPGALRPYQEAAVEVLLTSKVAVIGDVSGKTRNEETPEDVADFIREVEEDILAEVAEAEAAPTSDEVGEDKPIGVVKEITSEGEIIAEMSVDAALDLVARTEPGPIDRVIEKRNALKAREAVLLTSPTRPTAEEMTGFHVAAFVKAIDTPPEEAAYIVGIDYAKGDDQTVATVLEQTHTGTKVIGIVEPTGELVSGYIDYKAEEVEPLISPYIQGFTRILPIEKTGPALVATEITTIEELERFSHDDGLDEDEIEAIEEAGLEAEEEAAEASSSMAVSQSLPASARSFETLGDDELDDILPVAKAPEPQPEAIIVPTVQTPEGDRPKRKPLVFTYAEDVS